MYQLSTGVIYSPELNKIFYSNEYIMSTGVNLQQVSNKLGVLAEYISDDERDLLYAKSKGIKIFDETPNSFDYALTKQIDIDNAINELIESNKEHELAILDEYNYIKKHEHNIMLLAMAFILKRHLNSVGSFVYLMRGSGVASFIFYLIGLNKVNPIKFGLDYKNFWNI